MTTAIRYYDEKSRALVQAGKRTGIPNLTCTKDFRLAVVVVSVMPWGHQDRVFPISNPMTEQELIVRADAATREELLAALHAAFAGLRGAFIARRREALSKFITMVEKAA